MNKQSVMTNKDRALAPFKRKAMDRFPMCYGADPVFTRNLIHYLGAETEDEALYDIVDIDFKTIRPKYIGPPFEKFEDGSEMTDWGIRRAGMYFGLAMNHPLAEADTIADVEKHKFPNPENYDVIITDEQKNWAKNYCLIGGSWAPFFHDSIELVGMEKLFMDMYLNESFVDAVVEKCFGFHYELDRRVFEQNPNTVDMYFIGNDYGSQRQLLLSPDMWRKFYKPRMAKLIEQAKRNGCVIAIHSCGSIRPIIKDLIEIGVDAINPIQVNAQDMNPEELIKEFGDDCVFFGGIDENEILLKHTQKDVREETRRIIDILGQHGRYIVSASHDYLLPEVPVENVFAMYDEAKKYGLGRNG